MNTTDIPALAEVSIEPMGQSEDHERAVQEAIDALRRSGLEIVPGAASTLLRAPLGQVWDAVHTAHTAVQPYAERVVTNVRVETRRDGDDFAERVAHHGA
ncbi:hypothetical protein ER308_01270 [Egibacter rhizosphaerae]|uniref:Thiamine-binding protein domain-containing protein n=1 Tax=Egibacter rhizosphaerae TaxID=1670831 RepID=A0A411YAV0_9ACTN|nr:thiamine-binding protein [Egibacter rhizosphaerae]QBI18334.1 hypothetical protein ER308_01270 [Egibacter rhizosphaerae]